MRESFVLLLAFCSSTMLSGCALWHELQQHAGEVEELGKTVEVVGAGVSSFLPELGIWTLFSAATIVGFAKVLKYYRNKSKE